MTNIYSTLMLDVFNLPEAERIPHVVHCRQADDFRFVLKYLKMFDVVIQQNYGSALVSSSLSDNAPRMIVGQTPDQSNSPTPHAANGP
jgi:hypothetical protein|tara:strand:- start:303 stop:566 length:264 start_codon:yes stop_codon:yes gene_type:complete